jgi:hypothetical protein
MQDRRQRFLWRRLPDQALAKRRGCSHQARAAGQAVQGKPAHLTRTRQDTSADHDHDQNRELQIMRIVRHPNIVELKAFFYNNGERVRLASLGLGVTGG